MFPLASTLLSRIEFLEPGKLRVGPLIIKVPSASSTTLVTSSLSEPCMIQAHWRVPSEFIFITRFSGLPESIVPANTNPPSLVRARIGWY